MSQLIHGIFLAVAYVVAAGFAAVGILIVVPFLFVVLFSAPFGIFELIAGAKKKR